MDNKYAPFDTGSVEGLWSTVGRGIGAKSVLNGEKHRELLQIRQANLPKAHAWREAALNDGWTGEPTYEREPIEHAARLTHPDGWVVQILSRPVPAADGRLPCPEVTVWAPDKAQVKVPPVYDFRVLQANARICMECGAEDVDTAQYAFATRCCGVCGPRYQASLPANWCE